MGVNFPLGKTGKSRAVEVSRGKRAPSAREEARLQSALLDYLAWTVPGVTAFAIPNASLRTRTGKAANFVPGLRKGVFDLCLILPPLPATLPGRVVFVEVKTEAGALSGDQQAFQDILIRAHVPHCIVRSIDDLREALKIWRVPTREIIPLEETQS